MSVVLHANTGMRMDADFVPCVRGANETWITRTSCGASGDVSAVTTKSCGVAPATVKPLRSTAVVPMFVTRMDSSGEGGAAMSRVPKSHEAGPTVTML